jgi:hypothetical protein
MTELLPCPFCGGEADVKVLEYDDDCKVWGVFCEFDLANEYSHGHFVDNYATEAEAIEAWNTRAVETCKLICHEVELPDSLKDADVEIYVYECSECGERMFSDYNYCPNCGAKVMGE